MPLLRNHSRTEGLRTLQDLYAETRRLRRKEKNNSIVPDDLKPFLDTKKWPGRDDELPSDIQYAVRKRERADAYNLECINPFTIFTILTLLSGVGVAAFLGTLQFARLGDKQDMRLAWLIPFCICCGVLVCSLCCCAGFKASVQSNLEPHVQALYFLYACNKLPIRTDASRDLYYELQLPLNHNDRDAQTPAHRVYLNGDTETRVLLAH